MAENREKFVHLVRLFFPSRPVGYTLKINFFFIPQLTKLTMAIRKTVVPISSVIGKTENGYIL